MDGNIFPVSTTICSIFFLIVSSTDYVLVSFVLFVSKEGKLFLNQLLAGGLGEGRVWAMLLAKHNYFCPSSYVSFLGITSQLVEKVSCEISQNAKF